MKTKVEDKDQVYEYWPMVDRFMGHTTARTITARQLIKFAKKELTVEYNRKMADEEFLLEYGRFTFGASKRKES